MNRTTGVIFAATVLSGVCLHAEDRPPNIVLIVADDLGYEGLAANGGEPYLTPRLDRMAREGIRFQHCHSQPLCTPSRVQLMTGQYNHRNYTDFGILDPSQKTLANLLRDHGYRTVIAGKWQLGGDKNTPNHFGFDQYCLWQLTYVQPNVRPRYPNPTIETDGKDIVFTGGEYGPDIVSDYLCDFFEQNKDRPFFAYYPMILPHWPFQPTPTSNGWNPRESREYHKKEWREEWFRDMVTYADKLVGKLLDKLEDLDLTRETIVIFTSDNGTAPSIMGGRLDGKEYPGGKGTTLDTGTRVPLVVYAPGRIPPGRVSDSLVDFSDFLPTVLELAGIPVPNDLPLDGVSFASELRGGGASPREWIYCWFQREGDRALASQHARDRRYKLYADGRFFDVEEDLFEKNPINESDFAEAQKAAHGALLAALKEKMAEAETIVPVRTVSPPAKAQD